MSKNSILANMAPRVIPPGYCLSTWNRKKTFCQQSYMKAQNLLQKTQQVRKKR